MDHIKATRQQTNPADSVKALGDHSKKRVFVVEDQSAICDLIAEMVQTHPRCELVGRCSESSDAVSLSLKLNPDILVLDVIMPDVGGIEVLQRLRGKLPSMKVLIFSGKQDPAVIRPLIHAGINGFVNKRSSLSDLRKALDALALGNNWFNDDFGQTVRETLTSPGSLGLKLIENLTERELGIAVLISNSHSSKEIASKLGISRKTVENHRANMMRKLGVHDVAGLVRLVIIQGLSET